MCGRCSLRHINILFLVKCVCERGPRKPTVLSHCPWGTLVIELYAAFSLSASLSPSSHRAALFIVMMNDYCQIKLLLPCTAPSHNRNQYSLIPHYSDVIWARWRIKSPASPLFIQPFIRTHSKENIKAPGHWPLCGEFTGDRWIPRTSGQ